MFTAAAQAEDGAFDPSRLEVTGLVSELKRPMELAVAPDGRVFYIELEGQLKVYDPRTRQVALVGEIEVTTIQENGLIGLALDPDFAQNRWIYLQYSPPDFPGQHVSRFTLTGGKLDPASEKLLLKYEEQREQCCHHAGSMEFGPQGNLFIGTGDNTHPGGDSQGYAPLDERPGRAPFDAQKSASNTMSHNGKILRIKPLPDGTYEIPEGDLFPRDGSGGLPEIYAMGCRNPWRINVDQKTGFVYWGEVGPDAGGDGPRGPRGYDEINQARGPGYFGWPYFIADNRAYHDVNFATGEVGEQFDVEHPRNDSPNNTGAKTLPRPQPAFIYYPYADSPEFPQLGKGGRTACAGPVYDFDAALDSATKFPRRFDRCLFIYEWTRHWIKAVHLDENSHIEKIEDFMPEQRFARPIDMEFGPEGALYMIEYGETWGVNADARLVRIDYARGNRPPIARAAAENNIGRQPLEVTFSSAGTFDKDEGDTLSYEWRATRASEKNAKPKPKTLSREANPKLTFDEPGAYNVELIVTDQHGARGAAAVPVLVGNARPTVKILEPSDGDFYDAEHPVHFRLYVKDFEDGTSDFDEADRLGIDPLDPAAPSRVTLNVMPLAAGGPGAEDRGPPGLQLMKKSDCFNCHDVNRKLVGPPLVEIAKKYRGQSGALEASVKRVLNGSTGAWGKVPMIPHRQHTPEEVREMVGWVYSLEEGGGLQVFQGFVGDATARAEDAKKGDSLVLEASYIDRGAGDVPPLAGSTKIVLRNRRVDAELADEIHGPRVLGSNSAHGKKFIGAIDHEHYLRFDQVPLDQVGGLTFRVTSAGSGGHIEVRRDRLDGPVLARVEVEVNGSWDAWHDRAAEIEDQAGRHDLYIVFLNPEKRGGLMNLDSIYFQPKK
jgi:cytochrome c